MQKKSKTQKAERLLLTFDISDDNQKTVYELLRNAGYGKRTPIIVNAILQAKTLQSGSAIDLRLEEIAQKAAERAASLAVSLVKKESKTEDKAAQKTRLPEPEENQSILETGELDLIGTSDLADAVRLSEMFN